MSKGHSPTGDVDPRIVLIDPDGGRHRGHRCHCRKPVHLNGGGRWRHGVQNGWELHDRLPDGTCGICGKELG